MHYCKHFLTALLIFIVTNNYAAANSNLSVNKLCKTFSDKNLFLAGNHWNAARKKKGGLYILFSPEGISSKEGNAIRIKNFKRLYKTGSFSIKLESNEKNILENQKVWGYQDGDSDIYRNLYGDFMKIEENGKMIIYSRKAKGFRGRQITVYYFSKTLDSPAYLLDKNNIFAQFKDNDCFLEKLNKRFNWPYDYTAWDKKKSSFKIVEIINECR